LQTGHVAFECLEGMLSSWCRSPRTGRRLPSHSFFIIRTWNS